MPQVLPPREQQEPEHPGFQIVGWLRPFGSALVLLILALFLVYAFTSGRPPIPGYTPPETGEYYAVHLDALAEELNTAVLPQLEPNASAAVTGDTVTVTLPEDGFAINRAAVLKYFDQELLTFEME